VVEPGIERTPAMLMPRSPISVKSEDEADQGLLLSKNHVLVGTCGLHFQTR
jgi:hypothetical protein